MRKFTIVYLRGWTFSIVVVESESPASIVKDAESNTTVIAIFEGALKNVLPE